MWYVIPSGAVWSSFTVNPEEGYQSFNEAKDKALALQQSFGTHWHVVKVTPCWVTTTLADLNTEGAI
jgi:hypothetical protein